MALGQKVNPGGPWALGGLADPFPVPAAVTLHAPRPPGRPGRWLRLTLPPRRPRCS